MGIERSYLKPETVCRDGFSISIQASQYHYCTPRSDIGPWTEVECGFPSSIEEDLLPYAEDPNNPLNTVYGYVPIEIISKIILKHDGKAFVMF